MKILYGLRKPLSVYIATSLQHKTKQYSFDCQGIPKEVYRLCIDIIKALSAFTVKPCVIVYTLCNHKT